MKIRNGFVANSSSTSFAITNITNRRRLTVKHLVQEIGEEMLSKYKKEYGFGDIGKFNFEEMLDETRYCYKDYTFSPGKRTYVNFGDDTGSVIGTVFDYMLREGGESKSFKWEFMELLR